MYELIIKSTALLDYKQNEHLSVERERENREGEYPSCKMSLLSKIIVVRLFTKVLCKFDSFSRAGTTSQDL